MPRTPPGRTRERVFRFVRDRLVGGAPPTLREVRDHFGFRAVETVRSHLAALVAEGRLEKATGRARGYRLPDRLPVREIPVLGAVAAGGFEEAIENADGSIPMDVSPHRREDEFFALRVRGESMTGAGILPGDMVIVERCPRPASGEIVVALVDNEATIKRLHVSEDRIELRPENDDFEVLKPPEESCLILGRVVELRRRF